MGGWHGRFRPRIFVVLLSALIALFASQTAYSEHADRQRPPPSVPGGAPVPNKPELGSIGERLNGNTIAIISGNVNATYLTIAYDLSAVLDNGDEFRVLPVIGKGGGQNIKDVRYLKGIDLGITQSNLLNAARRSGEMGNIDDKIVYIAKLFNEEMHLIVRADSGITSIDQLAGKVVNFSDIGSGTQLSSRDIFQRLGIKAQEVNLGQADAIEQLKSGQIAATVLIAGKPAASMAKLKASEGFRVLTVPFRKELQADYLPATLTSADYPNLVGNDAPVDTIACGAVLIAYNWPKGSDRYRRIQAFVDNFFPKLAEFQKPPRHPKWKETNLAAVLPGWNRFDGADDWIRQQPQAQRDQFDRFVAGKRPGASPEERDQLFKDFVQWRNAQGSSASSNTKGSN